MEIGTVFVVRAITRARTLEYGPYVHLKEATDIFVDYLDDFVQADLHTEITKYQAQIVEKFYDAGTWQDIYVKVHEER